MNETPPTAAAEEERPPICPTAGPETPDPEQRAEAVLLAPSLTVRETEIAEIARRLCRTVEAIRADDSQPAGRMNETPPTAAAEEERLPVCPTAGPETPDPEQRAEAVLLARSLTVGEAEVAEIGLRHRRTVRALRESRPPPAGA